jgi:hypothetical protein
MINKERVKLLVDTLRSGEYKQTSGALRKQNGYCCLGVACDIAAKHGVGEWEPLDDEVEPYYRAFVTNHSSVDYLPPEVMEWFGFSQENPDLSLGYSARPASWFNDALFSFDQIADGFEHTYLKD